MTLAQVSKTLRMFRFALKTAATLKLATPQDLVKLEQNIRNLEAQAAEAKRRGDGAALKEIQDGLTRVRGVFDALLNNQGMKLSGKSWEVLGKKAAMVRRAAPKAPSRTRRGKALVEVVHVCTDDEGNPRTDDDDRPLKPDKTTCGKCGRSWCDRCDPTHGPLCPWCAGYGYSSAPMMVYEGEEKRDAEAHQKRLDRVSALGKTAANMNSPSDLSEVYVFWHPEGIDADHAVHELVEMFIPNDMRSYDQWRSIEKNLATKKARGVYDAVLAPKLTMYLVQSAAQSYVKQHGERGDVWHKVFPMEVRQKAAQELVTEFERDFSNGELDDMLPKKYQKKPGKPEVAPAVEEPKEAAKKSAARDELTKQDYQDHVDAIADDAIASIKNDEITDRNGLFDWMHETVDGDGWVIYTAKAELVLKYSRNKDAMKDETGEDPFAYDEEAEFENRYEYDEESDDYTEREDWSPPRDSQKVSQAAYYALHADLAEAIDDKLSEYDTDINNSGLVEAVQNYGKDEEEESNDDGDVDDDKDPRGHNDADDPQDPSSKKESTKKISNYDDNEGEEAEGYDEAQDEGPAPEDYVLSPSGELGSRISVGQVEGKFLGEFSDQDAAVAAIQKKMEKEQFWPSVWFQDDHGGITPVSFKDAAKKTSAVGGPNSGYHDCPCRDCFEIAIGEDDEGTPNLCNICQEAGCTGEIDEECQAESAYGGTGDEG